MKILVTGAGGFVGRHLIAKLLQHGHSVRAVVHREKSVANLRPTGIEILVADIREPTAMDDAVRQCDIVYHLAAKTSKHKLSKKEYYSNNADGTANVARATLKAGVPRLVYASSIGVYGTTSNWQIDERTRPAPDSHYRQTKLKGEEVVLRLNRDSQLPVVIARLGNVYGPGSTSMLDVCRKLQKANFRLVGRGDNYLGLVYVDDLVDGLWRCGETPGIEGETFVLPGAEPTTARRFLDILKSHIGVGGLKRPMPEAPFWLYARLGHVFYRLVGCELPRAHYYDLGLIDQKLNGARARERLNYCPRTTVEEGGARLVEWYQREGLLAGSPPPDNDRVDKRPSTVAGEASISP